MTGVEKSNVVKESIFQSFAELDPTLEAKDVKRQNIVSGKVISWDNKRNGLLVIFGNQIKGFIPKEHMSIYPSYDKVGVPSEATYIIEKNIIAEVIDYNSDKTEFTLSRLNCMKKRIEDIKVNNEITVCVTKVREKDIFVDVGSGVWGRVGCEEISGCYVEDMAYLGYHEGCIITLKVINIENNKFNLSRKKMYPEYDMSAFNFGDEAEARILSELTSPEATSICPYPYWVEVADNPNIKGILDSDIPLSQGVVISVKIKAVTPKGLRLRLASI